MCGINFLLREEDPGESSIQAMNTALYHRGPDHTGFHKLDFGDFAGYLGNTRLRILDPDSRSDQPFVSEDGRYMLSFNGEIFNYFDLKNDLRGRNIVFRTNSDTEVLFHALIQHGEDSLSKLNGMFSLVFLDLQQQKAIMARDCFGIKPLFYSHTPGSLIASSELKGILASGLVNKELNQEQIKYYLDFAYARPPETFFKGIYEVQPGEVITYQKGHLNKRYYTEPGNRDQERDQDPTQIVSKTHELLTDSLSNMLATGPPPGLFLSGGVDSTLLLAIARKELGKDLMSFSLAADKSAGSYGTLDYKFARQAAAQYGSAHHEFTVSPQKLEENWTDFMDHMDQPVGDSGAFMTYILSKETSAYTRVVLSGAGADEYFAGYERHRAFYQYLKRYNLFTRQGDKMHRLIRILPTGLNHPLRSRFKHLNQFFESLDVEPAVTFDNFRTFGKTKSNTRLLKPEEGFIQRNFENALKKDQKEYLVSDVLKISDQFSMANHQELRVPYLDLPLTQLLAAYPSDLMIQNGRKWILKDILTRLDGKVYAERKKAGFGLPFGQWLREDNNKHLHDLVQNKNSIIFNVLSFDHWSKIVNDHKKKKADHTRYIWSVLVLKDWIRQEFGDSIED